jgi:hypothetical protein
VHSRLVSSWQFTEHRSGQARVLPPQERRQRVCINY